MCSPLLLYRCEIEAGRLSESYGESTADITGVARPSSGVLKT